MHLGSIRTNTGNLCRCEVNCRQAILGSIYDKSAPGMYMISENAVRLSVKEGAKIFSEEPVPRQARDALEKGIKLAEAGIKLAKNNGLATAPELMGSLLCARAQGLTLKARFDEALSCADEAVLIYRDLGCPLDGIDLFLFIRNNSSVLVLCHRPQDRCTKSPF